MNQDNFKNQKFSYEQPIFITGRGGSGTRLLSKLLLQAGVFLGNELNPQGDSLEWLEINRQLVIKNILVKNGLFNKAWIEKLRQKAKSIIIHENQFVHPIWGAKLPEFMLCAEELQHAFPDAKFIHLLRHPISLCNRRTHITSRWGNPIGKLVLENAYKKLNKNRVNKKHINNAVSWYFQVDKMVAFAENNLSNDNYLPIKFEEIILNTQNTQSKILNFIGINSTKAINLEIDPSRTNLNIEKSKEADEVWEICGKTAEKIGYDKYIIT